VDVRNYHRFARGYLAHRGKMATNSICAPALRKSLCEESVKTIKLRGDINLVLDRPSEFLVEEFRWLAQHGIVSADDYVSSERTGRAGTRVARGDRPIVFEAYEQYRTARAAQGKDYDWDDLPQTVLSEFELDSEARMYKHVIIDEGQDFSPIMIRSLAAAIPEDGSLTIFGDMAQQIYGNRISWRSAGLKIKEVWRFQENYRNTKQVARLALALAATPHFQDVSDLVEPKAPAADGAPPALIGFESEADEIRFVAEQAEKRARTGTVAVLFRDRELEATLPPLLGNPSTRLHRQLDRWPSGPRVFHGTYHSAKGLEFDAVYLPYVSAARLPHPPDVTAFGHADAAARDAMLLYVSITRARSDLVLTYSGAPTALLPLGPDLVQRSER
jgi:superfamily I DNA/RNA helicase